MSLCRIQEKAINKLSAGLTSRRRGRAALLQLPTGFGKSHVAVGVYRELLKTNPSLNLVIVLPRKGPIPGGWCKALELAENPSLNKSPSLNNLENRPLRAPGQGPRGRGLLLLSLRTFKRALLASAGGTPKLAKDLAGRKCLIVIDEFHRATKELRSSLSAAFTDPETEHAIRKPFLKRRGSARWPCWLLLSATPVNPVIMDDQIDGSDRGVETAPEPPDLSPEREATVVRDEVHRTFGSLAWCAGLRRNRRVAEPWGRSFARRQIGTAQRKTEWAVSLRMTNQACRLEGLLARNDEPSMQAGRLARSE
jgi:hypothetical protein